MRKIMLLIGTVTVILTACWHSGGNDIAFEAPQPDKSPPRSNAVVRAALYVDTGHSDDARNALGSVGRYYVIPERNGTEVPYFDYVIISGAAIKQGTVTTYLAFSEELQAILHDHRNLLKPLRDRGIKVLLGVTGGRDGTSFGCLAGETEQKFFARQCVDACYYYKLDGVEFWDKDGTKPGIRNTYPAMGSSFFNGEKIIAIPPDPQTGYGQEQYYWKMGGGNVVDMMSYMIELFGASSSFQGDVTLDQKGLTPILVRETNYGQWIPAAVPRYAFSTSMSCLTYLVNNSTDTFGWENTGDTNQEMNFVGTRSYAPVIIDLNTINEETLRTYSERLGRSSDSDGELTVRGNSQYGLVYYTNLGSPTAEQTALLSLTAQEVFGAGVIYH